jgi:hypothetical protein
MGDGASCSLEIAEYRSLWEAFRPLWHPDSARSAALRSACDDASASPADEALADHLLHALRERGGASLPVSSRALVDALSHKGHLSGLIFDCAADAAEVVAGSIFARCLRRLSALAGALHARQCELVGALLEEVVALRGGGGGAPLPPSSLKRAPAAPPPPPPPSRRVASPQAGAAFSVQRALRAAPPPPPQLPSPRQPTRRPTSPAEEGGGGVPGAAAAAAAAARLLSLRQLHDFLSALYASKERADVRARTAGLPLDTLEAHLRAFVRTTVGIRALVAAQTRSFLSSLEAWAPLDVDALLAGKLLRCEVDEGFRGALGALREAAADALRRVVREAVLARGGGPEAAAGAYMARVGAGGSGGGGEGGAPVPEAEWRSVVSALFSGAGDVAEACARLRAAAVARASAAALGVALWVPGSGGAPPGGAAAAAGSEASIAAAAAGLAPAEADTLLASVNPTCALPWPVVVRELCLMAVERQERFIAGFAALWRRADGGGAGRLPVGVFAAAVAAAAPRSAAAAAAAALEAAFSARRVPLITFSEAVGALGQASEAEAAERARAAAGAEAAAAAALAAAEAEATAAEAARAKAEADAEAAVEAEARAASAAAEVEAVAAAEAAAAAASAGAAQAAAGAARAQDASGALRAPPMPAAALSFSAIAAAAAAAAAPPPAGAGGGAPPPAPARSRREALTAQVTHGAWGGSGAAGAARGAGVAAAGASPTRAAPAVAAGAPALSYATIAAARVVLSGARPPRVISRSGGAAL